MSIKIIFSSIYKFAMLSMLSLTFCECSSPYKVHTIDGVDLSSIKSKTKVEIRSDGLYSLCDASTSTNSEKPVNYYIYSPLVFLNDSVGRWKNYAGYYNDEPLRMDFYTQLGKHFEIGVGRYVLSSDTLFAKLPITLYGGGMRQQIYEAYFQGTLKNRDTIVDWHMIPPYPKANRRLNDDFDFLKTPHMLYFIESKELLGLDSLYQVQRYKGKTE